MNRRSIRAAGGQVPVEAVLSTAANHAKAGRAKNAIKLIDKNPAARAHPIGQMILGNAYLTTDQLEPALGAFDAVVAAATQMPEGHANRGVVLERLGRFDEALGALDRAIAIRNAYPLAHFNRGNVLRSLGRADMALGAYDQALRLQADFPEAHLNRGFAFLNLSRPAEALAAFDQALGLRSMWIEALLGRATALNRLNRPAEALEVIAPVVADQPRNADALIAQGDALAALQRGDDARVAYEAALDQLGDTEDTSIARATALNGLERYEEALKAAEAGVAAGALGPGHIQRASALRGLGWLAEQLTALDDAVAAGESGTALDHSRAIALGELGYLDRASEAFEKALAIAPEDARLQTDFGRLLLHRGNYERGLAAHEARIRLADYAFDGPGADAPVWMGEDLTGKHLLVHAEQELGDTIQMLRFMPFFAVKAGRVSMAIQKPLRGLAADSLRGIEVIDGDGVAGCDVRVSLMSLPHRFGVRPETVPADVPYLSADQDLVAKWRDAITGPGMKIGISWAGNPDHKAGRHRSIPLEAFRSLAEVPGVRLISLQAQYGLDQLDRLPEDVHVERLDDLAGSPDRFRETAAAMMNLDLVISADTAVAHLAGALGQPVWTALSSQPEWRWPEGKSETPWYPTMWLFRQPAPADWDAVFADMAGYLKKHVTERG